MCLQNQLSAPVALNIAETVQKLNVRAKINANVCIRGSFFIVFYVCSEMCIYVRTNQWANMTGHFQLILFGTII